jgi:hypothetical protein
MSTNRNRDKEISIYLICEGTSCSHIRKSLARARGINLSAGPMNPLSDFGIIESNYFERNTENTKHMKDDGSSIYMASAKMSAIDTALIAFGNSSQRDLYVVPYTSDDSYIQSKNDYGLLVDTFGMSDDADRYIQQNKFSELSSYMPSSTVSLNWSIRPYLYSAFHTIHVGNFIKLIQTMKKKSPEIESVFLVCPMRFIVAMMNAVRGSGYNPQKDVIENTSFWKFTCSLQQGLLFRPVVKDRYKMYPLSRNTGSLKSQGGFFYYVYQDEKVPVFRETMSVPAKYLSSRFLTLCPPAIQRHIAQRKNVNVSRSRSRNMERKNRYGAMLKKITTANF